MTTQSGRHLAVAPDPKPEPLDLCVCGHSFSAHQPLDGRAVCLAFVPGLPLKSVDRGLDPIAKATEIAFASKSKAASGDHSSSVCACVNYTPSGMRVIPPTGAEERRAVQDGRLRRTVGPIA